MEFPKIVALDLDNTFWSGWLNEHELGKNGWVGNKIEDNLEIVQNRIIRDTWNHLKWVKVSDHIFSIISDLIWNQVSIAIVSRNSNKDLCDRALWLFQVEDPWTLETSSLTKYIKYDEIIDQSKQEHFQRIKDWSGVEYHDMILFDDEPRNSEVELWQGVTFHKVHDPSVGLTWQDYQRGLRTWRRNNRIRRPMPGAGPDPLPNRKHIGYVGTDYAAGERYRQGLRRLRSNRPSRWGWGMYVTDNPRIATAFAKWGRENDPPTNHWFCPVFVRDFVEFCWMDKVWVKETGVIRQTDNLHNSDQRIAEVQLERDRQIASAFGVSKPYILFSKHHYMSNLRHHRGGGGGGGGVITTAGAGAGVGGITPGTRFNEMVVYPQVQDALFYGTPIPLARVAQAGATFADLRYHNQIRAWNIKANTETYGDFRAHGEPFM